MTRESYLLLILGLITFTFSFSLYNFATAQINSSNTTVGGDIIRPITPTSNLNNTQIEDKAINNMNNWTVISGNWTTLDGSLHGGSPNNTISPLTNIILNSETSENFSGVSTSFKVNKLDITEANYAWIVYSFVDPDNYKLVGINIFNDAVYAVGYTVNDGNLVAEPLWPGILTNLTYTPGSTYNLTLVNQGSSLDLFINGKPYLTKNINDGQINLGEVGLAYGRIQDISFIDFNTETSDQQQLISNNTQRNTIQDSFTSEDTETILLEGKSLPENDYIHLYDTSPYQIASGHIAANLPCDDNNNAEVNVLVGQAPVLAPTELEYISDLSIPGEMCLYHANINPSDSNPITDIAVGNNSTDDIEFPDTSSIVISISGIAKIQ